MAEAESAADPRLTPIRRRPANGVVRRAPSGADVARPGAGTGRTGRGCFSQWWPAPFTVDGITYPTAEHWMMAGKARLFGDEQGLEKVLAAKSPGAAKAARRQVRGFDEDAWTVARYDIVLAGTIAKFTQHLDLADILTRTGTRLLAEASPFDRIWGIGMSASSPDADRPSRWRGLNLLGFALLDARDHLTTPGADP